MYEYNATLIRVVDGDTFDVEIDLGFSVFVHERLRLRGVNAPERFTTGGKEATKFVRKWFAARPWFTLKTYKGDLNDKYGRWVADVIATDGSDLAADMLTAKVAVPFLP